MNLGHEMIFASAGSGKTHALTTRFLRLLAAGVPPERIVALTFTRKAAGEFFTEIVQRLVQAAETPGAAVRLGQDVGQPHFGPAEWRLQLRALVRQMHRLSLGTLDGFFARLVHAYPLELGLAGEPEVLDEPAAAEEMRRVLARLMAPRGGLREEQKALIEAFKLATFGTEDKAVTERLDTFVGRHLALYRSAPAAVFWGASQRIWPEGFPWGEDNGDPSAAAAQLRAWALVAPLREKQRERWLKFAQAAEQWTPGGPLPRELLYVLEKALEAWPAVQNGCAELKFDRVAQPLSPEACAALTQLVRRVVALELGRRLAVTQGIGSVLRAFDALYDAEVRRSGRLTFADVQQLLVPGSSSPRWSLEAGGDRQQVDYRLDARLDHWMLDEFQDTSFPQWQILESLVDEVMQDPSGRRSFFFVGDVKQAIYTWREGDPRLFTYVARRYRGGLVERELNDSWRSGPEVIEMVNRVCGDAAVMRDLFPEAAGAWNGFWREHRSARPERHGQAALLHAPDEAGRWRVVLELLQAIDPPARGLTCAILVRTNDTGARLAHYLRREAGIPAVAEADLHIATDNPVTGALIALIRWAAHPGDSLAEAQVRYSPVGDWLKQAGCEFADAISASVLREIQAQGFHGWARAWCRRLEDALAPEDRFSRLRLEQLVQAARQFDEANPGRSIDGFLRYLESYAVREPEGAGVVRIMTIHKSKGLGFDIVLLPDLEGDKLAQRRKGPAVRKGDDRAIEWILEFPGDLLARHDPVLRDYLQEAVAENCYEQLSLLYVALTRAKYAMYAVIEPLERSTSLNFPRLLTDTLGEEPQDVQVGDQGLVGPWSVGQARWFEAHADRTVPAPDKSLPVWPGTAPLALSARRPSAEKHTRIDAGDVFTDRSERAAGFGSGVHALLAEVSGWPWAEVEEAEALIQAWLRRPELDAAARDEAIACLRASELAPLWTATPDMEVWRERAFELIEGGEWITGTLDRVLIRRAGGRVERVSVYDFKTDRVGGGDLTAAARRHETQLDLYRRAVGRLLGLAPAQVEGWVVFTALPRAVRLA